MGKTLRDHFLRIDARSLGLFRWAFGLVLVCDLARRLRFVKEFYSNDGVLPNHNHLFNLRDKEPVWSALHAFSSVGENITALLLILVFYALFLVGYRTRVFQALALVSLVSLTSRNILLENAGNYLAIALLAFTLFLPLGSRFSLDSLLASMDERDEKTARELNDRSGPDGDVTEALRRPGWSPVSFAALAVLAQIAIVYAVLAHRQSGAMWRDGTALHYALNAQGLVSAAGASARSLPPGLLSLWTRLFHSIEWLVPALLVIPASFRVTRTAAFALALVHGLTLGVFFSLGLFGWSLVAASALLLPVEVWNRIEGARRPGRRRTVIYDADCGVCLFLARVAKRLDLRHHLAFQGNDDLDGLSRLKADGTRHDGAASGPKPRDGKAVAIERAPLPKEITPELVQATVIVVDGEGRVLTRSRAVAEVVQALPLGQPVAWLMRLPGVAQLLDVLYDVIATRRQRISVLMGKEACGVDLSGPSPADQGGEEAPAAPALVPPATRLARIVTGTLRDATVAAIFVAALAQTAKANELSWPIPQGPVLQGIAVWPRMLGRWDVMAPEPPAEDGVFVIDAQTKGGRSVDTLTGKEPNVDPGSMRGTGLGQLWNDYLDRIHRKEWSDFQRAFRDYLGKGGPAWDGQTGDNLITGFDAYWVHQAIPPPGAPRAAEPVRDKIFTHSRGGRINVDKALPVLRPDLRKR